MELVLNIEAVEANFRNPSGKLLKELRVRHMEIGMQDLRF
jgi:hypothetical protein